MTLTKRLVKGSALTAAEHDGNVDEITLRAPLASPTFTGTVSGITKSMVGLGSVDNTADTAKPVSTAQQTALDLKAPIASPTLTGTPAAPSAALGTDTTQIATMAAVNDSVTQQADNAKTVDFTFALADGATPKLTRSNSASSVTGTVPPNSSVAFPIGQRLDLYRSGAGAFVIAAGAGVTINKPSDRSLSLRAQHSGGTLLKQATDTWVLLGDLT
jgi:hypothetical protein